MSKVIEGLLYSESHEWVKVEDGIAIIGITEFGAVESVKAASDLFSPVSGTVVEVNESLEDSPELLNEDAFANWIIKVQMSDEAELEELMGAAAYQQMCQN